MRLSAILLCQALLAIRIELPFGSKEVKEISPGEQLYQFNISHCDAGSRITVNITTQAQKDNKKALPALSFSGTPAAVAQEIAAQTLEEVVSKSEVYDVKVLAFDHATNKKAKVSYAFKAVPLIQVTYLHRGLFKNVTFPLKYAQVKGVHKDHALRIKIHTNPDGKGDGVNVRQEGEYLMLDKPKEGPPPELRFHLMEEGSEQRSADLVIPAPGKSHGVNRLQTIIFIVSLTLIVAMIGVLGIYYYRSRNALPPTDEERGTVPLFTSPAMPLHAADPYAAHPHVLDLHGAHAK